MRREVLASCLILLVSLLVSPACRKQAASVARVPIPARTPDQAPPAPAVPSPSLEISASPSTIQRGQQTELSWKSTDASSILVDSGVGNVSANGSLVVSPLESTTYTAIAKGPGGEARASTRVTVVRRSAKPLIGVTDIQGLQRAIDDGHVQPIFFDYDRAQLTPQAMRTLKENAGWIRQFPEARLVIEGHCDERGTEEYNLALGDRRAQAAQDYLVNLGVTPAQLAGISYGEERPFSQGHDEGAWRLNRRAHFVVRR